ncbi:hypothetical protein [Lactobacillus delbrueckii]|uniref:hypothetical protein n=1 Tax=Lactobacillus delbrueckii TaxID=1584 RepID=UPI0022E540ED|nr:hypothetical protein [Lactobacillus delbrueckii]
MPRGGFREGAGRPKSGRKVHTIRATDEEWKLIKAYAEQVKLGKLPELSKAKEVKPVKETKAAVNASFPGFYNSNYTVGRFSASRISFMHDFPEMREFGYFYQ